MMTLYRKRIVRGRTHVLVYSGCLLLSGYHIVRLLPWSNFFLVMAAFALRVNLPRGWSNKYVPHVLHVWRAQNCASHSNPTPFTLPQSRYLIWVTFLLAASWGGVLMQHCSDCLQGSAPQVHALLMQGGSALQAIRSLSFI